MSLEQPSSELPSSELPSSASLWRRLAAIVYDSFLIIAIWMLSTFMMVAVFNGGDSITGPAYRMFLYLEAGVFYVYFWHFKGQTLGMQVWKIRTINDSGQILTLEECMVRYFFATFSLMFLGLGFVWILFDSERLTWHDRASGTRVLYLGKDPYATPAASQADE